ncbi:Eukaryotic translation initiation factor 5A [Entomortierella beljakovae]|nr:Eukaryotic translation initiation factor 5A [Entomortierella beljakovae]
MNNTDDNHTQIEDNIDNTLSYPVLSRTLEINDYVILRNQRPCKIVNKTTSKPGKSGRPKVLFVGIDIITGRKFEDIFYQNIMVQVPKVEYNEYPLLDITDDTISLLTESGELYENIRNPMNKLAELIRCDFESGKNLLITIVSSMEEEGLFSYKEIPPQ